MCRYKVKVKKEYIQEERPIMKKIFYLLLVIFSSNSLGNTDLLFKDLYNGLKNRKLLLRNEIQNIHNQYENNLKKSNQNFVLQRLKAILGATDSISTTKVNRQYIKNNVTKLMRSIEFDMNNTKLALPKKNRQDLIKNNKLFRNSTSLEKLMKANSSINEIKNINIKQSTFKDAPQDLNLYEKSSQTSTNFNEFIILIFALCLAFVVGRKSIKLKSNLSNVPNPQPNNHNIITLTQLLNFLTDTFNTPALLCDSKEQVKWSNTYSKKELDIQEKDIFDFHAESIVLGAHRYLKCSDTYYLAQSKKIKNNTLYYFIPLEIGPTLTASKVVTSINSIDKNDDSLARIIQHFKDEFHATQTSLELTTNIHKDNLCSPKHLNIIHSFLKSLSATIESESKSHVSVKLDIKKSASSLNLDFDVSNISSNALRFAFSVNQKKLEDLNLSCTFFNGEKSIKAKVLYRPNYIKGISGIA